jgi:hypothetical protein
MDDRTKSILTASLEASKRMTVLIESEVIPMKLVALQADIELVSKIEALERVGRAVKSVTQTCIETMERLESIDQRSCSPVEVRILRTLQAALMSPAIFQATPFREYARAARSRGKLPAIAELARAGLSAEAIAVLEEGQFPQ